MAQGQQEQVDSNIRILYAAVVLVVIVCLAWFFGHAYIVRGLFAVRRIEIDLVMCVLTPINAVLNFLHLPVFPIKTLWHWHEYMASPALAPTDVTLTTMGKVSQDVGRFLCIPFAAAILGCAAYMHFKHKGLRFTRIYSMKSLRALESDNWPQITPIVDLDLVKQDIDKGPWAMAQTPLAFGQKHHLIHPKQAKGITIWGIDHGAAAREFTMQLGPRWNDPCKQPIYVQALIVAFILFATKQRDAAKDLLEQISRSAKHTGKLDFTGVAEKMHKLRGSSLLKFVAKKHAYLYTVMATLIHHSRQDGVVATADFLWLKPVDRSLWYMLNSIGRQTVVIEVAGPYAHWLAERKIGRPLVAPMVKAAVLAMEEAVGDTLYIAEGEQWQVDAV